MATLRDFVSNKRIKAPEQNGSWIQIDFDNEGYSANQGPELGEAFYNFINRIQSSGEKTIEVNMSWEKIHEPPTGYTGYTEFYPIIGVALDLDGVNPGAFHLIGENQWWNNGNSITQRLGLYKNTVMAKSEIFATEVNNFEAYYDNEWALVSTGFDTVCQASYAPQYDMYWYKPGAYANVLNSGLWYTPYIINGDPRHTYNSWFNIFYASNPAYTESNPCLKEVSTNIPVICFDFDYYTAHSSDINSAMHSYLTDGDLSRFASLVTNGYAVIANKFEQPTTEGVKSFQCYCDVYEGTFDYSGVTDEEFIEYRYLQVFVKPSLTSPRPRVTLIKEPTSSELKARIKVYGDIEEVRYSTDGGHSWTTSDSLPWQYLYYKRTDEIGTLKYDQNHGGNMLLFASESLSDDGADWLADDYGEKSQYYPASNDSGTAESSTTMATTSLNSFFQRMYLVDAADMAIISSALYDTTPGGIWEDIKQGIDMFGENPIDCVAGLLYMPFDCTTVFTGASSATSIFFGGYQLTGVNVYELMNYNGYLDIGTVEIKESFPHGSYRNYEPFTSLKIWLPFVGLKELHLNKYVGKQLSVRYYFDCFNGGCLAVLFADGLMTDIFDGMAGVQVPISLTDFASYAAAQIQNFTELGSSAASAFIPLAGGATPSSLIGAAAGTINFEKSLFNASQTTTSNFNTTKGASSAMINQYLPNYVFLIFEIIEEDETDLLSELMGKPSNASGTLGSFSGYLEVDDIELKTSSGMTEKEKNQFISLCHSGIII